MSNSEFGCRATIIGSMPHKDAAEACDLVVRYLPDFPAWPQLPNRSFFENMYVQYSEGFPGVVLDDNRIHVDRSGDLSKPLERLYSAYLENDSGKYPIGPDYAAGLHRFLGQKSVSGRAVKGQVTGPISWGLTVTDEDRRAILYDDTLADAAARLLRLKASWQEKKLKEIAHDTIIFVDEPYMASFGSAFVSLSREKAVSLINEVFAGITGTKGVHCCGNTDWPVLLQTNAQILSFDAYNYSRSLSLYPAEIRQFLDERKGTIAWGIVPNDAQALARETVTSLRDRLEEAVAPFTRNGIPFRQVLRQSLVTPSCGLASLTEEAAARVLELLSELSQAMRQRYL